MKFTTSPRSLPPLASGKCLESNLKIPRNLSVAHIRYDQVVSCAIIILYVYILCNSVEGFLFFLARKLVFGEGFLFFLGEKSGLARWFCFVLARKMVWRGVFVFFWREKLFGEVVFFGEKSGSASRPPDASPKCCWLIHR